MNHTLIQANKEWVEFRRDRLSLALAFLLPVFSMFLFGYGIRLESKNIPVVIQDFDQTSLSREYTARLFATNIMVPIAFSGRHPSDAIDQGLAKVAVIIPPGFAGNFMTGQKAALQVLIDGTDISNSELIMSTIEAANLYFIKLVSPAGLAKHIVVPKIRIWFNPGRKERLFIVPGVFGVILWMFPALLSAVAASREKEQGTIVQVYSSKIKAIQFLLGKALVYTLVGLCMSLLIFVVGWLMFDVAPVGDPSPLIVATPLYVLSSVLFGIVIGTYASNQTVAVQGTSTGGFFPCLLLSGFVYPVDNIPFPLNLFSIIVPARYYIDLCRDAFERGVGWAAVWQDVTTLLVFIVVLLSVSWLGLFKMQLKD